MCLREITCCDPAIISIMFLHGEDMQPSGLHGKEGVDMIVQMDADECEKSGSDPLPPLAPAFRPRCQMNDVKVPSRSRDDRIGNRISE